MATVSRRIHRNKGRGIKQGARKPKAEQPDKIRVEHRTHVTLSVGKRRYTTQVLVQEDPQLMLADAVNALSLQDVEQAVMGYNGQDYTYNRI